MTEREELEKIIKQHKDLDSHRFQCIAHCILSWHSRHQRKVSREQVRDATHRGLDAHNRAEPGMEAREAFEGWVDDLLSLLNGEVEWCEHWFYMGDGYWRRTKNGPVLLTAIADDAWVLCPICGAKRPERDG